MLILMSAAVLVGACHCDDNLVVSGAGGGNASGGGAAGGEAGGTAGGEAGGAAGGAAGGTAGGAAGGTAGGEAGGAAGGTAGGSTVSAFVPASWVKTVQGILVPGGPQLRVGPDGNVMTVVRMGYSGNPTIIGGGEPNEVQWTERFQTAVASFDSSDGHLLSAARVTSAPPGPYAGTAPINGFAVTPSGEAVTWGTFDYNIRFFPGTWAQVDQSTLFRTNGSRLDRAEDPFLARFTPTLEPVSLMRGRTPAPLLKTWFNSARGALALPSSDVLVWGYPEQAGLIIGDGKAGQTTLGGTGQELFIARVDRTGNPVWVKRGESLSLESGALAADGSVYLHVTFWSDTSKLFAGSPDEITFAVPAFTIPDAGAPRVDGIVKLSPSLTLEWVRYRASASPLNFVTDLEPWGDGVALMGNVGSGFTVYAPDAGSLGGLVPAAGSTDQSWVGVFEGDGRLGWLRSLDSEGYPLRGGLAVHDRTVKLLSKQAGPVSGLTLPPAADGGTDQQGSFLIGYTFSPAGQQLGTALIAQDLGGAGLVALPDGGLVAEAIGFARTLPSRVGERDGGARPLPTPPADWDQMLYLLRVDF